MEPGATEDNVHERLRKRVLLVEENFLLRWDAAEYLREIGFDVFEAVSATEAQAVLAAASGIDAILCDVHPAPNPEGHDFLRWLGQRYPTLPVIVTARDRSVAALFPDSATRRFVAKPYKLSDIEASLRQVTDT